MDPQTIGLYGGIAGGVIGLLGGLAGTAAGILNTSGARERTYVIRCAALMWVVMSASLTAGFLLPGPFRSLAMLPVFLALPWLIRAWNRRQNELRGRSRQAPPAIGDER